jgi:Zn-dependent peptidase ImmA (M78 family)
MMLKIKRSKILLILEWCQKKFKHKDNLSAPKLFIYNSRGKLNSNENLWGAYVIDSNRMNIFLPTHNTKFELVNTVLHEYKHYLLNRHHNYEKIYDKLKLKKFNDSEIASIHPHEKLCNMFAKKWEDVCYNEIFQKKKKI